MMRMIPIPFFPFLFLGLFFLPPEAALSTEAKKFDGAQAMEMVTAQTALGPRYVSSPGHKKTHQFLEKEIKKLVKKGKVELLVQKWNHKGMGGQTYPLKNIAIRFSPEKEKRIFVGGHFDTRQLADKDPDPKNHLLPVIGANDAGSGTAVLLGLMKNLSLLQETLNIGVDLIFIDGEEGETVPFVLKGKNKGQLQGKENWVWKPLGSIHLAENLKDFYPRGNPKMGVILDMVCDKDLTLYYERNSLSLAPKLTRRIWEIGAKISPQVFISREKYTITDDHMPFNEKGIPSALLIDFDYSPWHTAHDTPDKCSQESLRVVGQTMLDFIIEASETQLKNLE